MGGPSDLFFDYSLSFRALASSISGQRWQKGSKIDKSTNARKLRQLEQFKPLFSSFQQILGLGGNFQRKFFLCAKYSNILMNGYKIGEIFFWRKSGFPQGITCEKKIFGKFWCFWRKILRKLDFIKELRVKMKVW